MYIRREATVGRSRDTATLTDDERKARMVEAEYFHLLRVIPNRVDDARWFLEDLGVAVAQPVANRWRRAGRGWKVRHVPVKAQAFDGYLFLGVRGRGVMWDALHETGLFRGVIGFDGRPARLTGEHVQMVMFRAETGGFDEEHPARKMASTMQRGDKVKLLDDGAFTGLEGSVDTVGDLTAKVMLKFCGVPTLREIAIEQLVKVAAKGA